MPDPTTYKFTNAWFFSDEEGGNPFEFEKGVPPMIGADAGVPALIKQNFEITDGLITGLKGDASLIFLGDLVDNQPYSIRCLRSMINLKKNHPDRVLLIGGNRDFNKIRAGFECYFNKDGGLLPWESSSGVPFGTIQEFLVSLENDMHIFRDVGAPEYLKGVTTWDVTNKATGIKVFNPVIESGYEKPKDFQARVEALLGATMGVNDKSAHLFTELDALFPSLIGKTPMVRFKFLCAMQMVMGLQWETLPAYLNDYNALYLDYIALSHVVAKFTIGNKTGLVSHGGLPFMEAADRSKHTLTAPLGYKAGKDAGLDKILIDIEKEKNELIEAVLAINAEKVTNGSLTVKHVDLISKFVHLTAQTTLAGPHVHPDAYRGTPIVSGSSKKPRDRTLGRLRFQQGGAWYDKKPEDTLQLASVPYGGVWIDFDIFGHAPQGYLPTARRNVETGTLYACLDVSKIEAQANSFSFAFLHIKKIGEGETLDTESEFIGRLRITLKLGDKAIKNELDITEGYAKNGKLIYYKEPIHASNVVDLDELRNIYDTEISFSYDAKTYARIVKNYTGAGGRRQTRRRKQRKQKSRRARTRRS